MSLLITVLRVGSQHRLKPSSRFQVNQILMCKLSGREGKANPITSTTQQEPAKCGMRNALVLLAIGRRSKPPKEAASKKKYMLLAKPGMQSALA